MTRRSTRWLATLGLLGVVAGATAALAALSSSRAVAPAQLSLNVVAPVFQVADLLPGDTMTRCLRVRNEGSDPIALVHGASMTGELASYLRISVENGSGLGDVGPSCAGFRSAGTYAYGTSAAGVAATALQPEYVPSWASKAEKSLRVTVAMPAEISTVASAIPATVAFAFAGYPLQRAGTTPPPLPGGIAPGTTGGFDKNGNFITNEQVKKRLRIGKARLLKNGNVRVNMFLPAGGAIRAKVILPSGVYYAHTLLPVEWGPKVRVLLKRRDVGKQATRRARRAGKKLVTTVTTRYRWAHGDDAYVQPEQKLTIVKKKRNPR